MKSPAYQPIDCSFHDILLDRATRRKIVDVIYLKDDEQQICKAVIKDVFTRKGEEFMLLDNDVEIRLDHLRSVDGISLEGGSCKVN